tara:strand:+ start:5098 stop:5394 length:297 start_codon:yes stop_codon:yes gene_type:complete
MTKTGYERSSDRTYNLKNKAVFSAMQYPRSAARPLCEHVRTVGGPGDNTTSVDPTFIGGLLRLKQSGKKGTDKKHGSYERYLAKKVHNNKIKPAKCGD